MADQTQDPRPPDPHPVGSVAQEAARLLDALGGWVSTTGYAAGPARQETQPREEGQARADGPAPEDAPQDRVSSDETRSHPAGHCDQCGAADTGGRAATCQWCPVCQGIDLLRSVRPETVERLADLAGALATALRDVATHHRSAGAPETAPHPERSHGATRVQDITIEDEDQGSATR